jgi:hypothetical protein
MGRAVYSLQALSAPYEGTAVYTVHWPGRGDYWNAPTCWITANHRILAHQRGATAECGLEKIQLCRIPAPANHWLETGR